MLIIDNIVRLCLIFCIDPDDVESSNSESSQESEANETEPLKFSQQGEVSKHLESFAINQF